jgi:hypothetical protein
MKIIRLIKKDDLKFLETFIHRNRDVFGNTVLISEAPKNTILATETETEGEIFPCAELIKQTYGKWMYRSTYY